MYVCVCWLEGVLFELVSLETKGNPPILRVPSFDAYPPRGDLAAPNPSGGCNIYSKRPPHQGRSQLGIGRESQQGDIRIRFEIMNHLQGGSLFQFIAMCRHIHLELRRTSPQTHHSREKFQRARSVLLVPQVFRGYSSCVLPKKEETPSQRHAAKNINRHVRFD